MPAAARTPPSTATLILLMGCSVLSLNMFVPSLVNIAVEFDADYGLVSLSIAGYLAVTAVLQLVFGPLSDRFGRRPVLIAALICFAAASVGCLLAETVWTFLAFRMLQGAIIAGSVLSRVIVRDTSGPQQAAARLGYLAMGMAIAPMLGPMVGGLLDEAFGWRASFLVYAAMGVVLLALVWWDLAETNLKPTETLWLQIRSYPDLLKALRFWAYAGCLAFSIGAFFAFIAGAPLVAAQQFGISAGALGVYIGSITCGFFFGSYVSKRLAGRFELETMMIAGRIVACSGLSAGLLSFLAGAEHHLFLFGATIFVGIGNGVSSPSSDSGLMSVRPDLAGTAAGLGGALVVGCGAVMTWISGTMVAGSAGAIGLLGLMLLTSFLGLLCALAAHVLSRRERAFETG